MHNQLFTSFHQPPSCLDQFGQYTTLPKLHGHTYFFHLILGICMTKHHLHCQMLHGLSWSCWNNPLIPKRQRNTSFCLCTVLNQSLHAQPGGSHFLDMQRSSSGIVALFFSEISFTLTKWLKCSSCNSIISADVAFVAAFKWQHSIAGFCRFDFIINDQQSLLLHNWICFCLWLQTWIGARRPDFWLATRKMPLFLSTQTAGRYCCRLICFLLWNLSAPRVLNSFWQTLQLKVWNTPSASSSISIKAMQGKLQKLWQDVYSSCQNTIWH